MAQNFLNLIKTVNPQIQEAQQKPSTRNLRKQLKTSNKRENLKSS